MSELPIVSVVEALETVKREGEALLKFGNMLIKLTLVEEDEL